MPMSISAAGAVAANGADAVLRSSCMALRILLKGEAALWRRAAGAAGGPRWRKRCRREGCWRGSLWRSAAGVAALLAAAAAAQAEQMSWRDVESRIQYAYYTEDAGALRNLGSVIAADT